MPATDERRPAGNGAAESRTTGQGDTLAVQRTSDVHRRALTAPDVSVIVVVDLTDLERHAQPLRSWEGLVRSRFWDLESLPAGTQVRVRVGRVHPSPMTLDGLDLGHLGITLEGADLRVLALWRSLLGAPRGVTR